MTGTEAQPRHNECTTPAFRGRQKRCTIRTCLRLSGSLHRTSTSCHGGEATGTRNRSPILVPGSVTDQPTPGPARPRPPHPAPVAQWIEQAPSKRLAAGSSPAGGASLRPPYGEGIFAGQSTFPSTLRSPERSPDNQGEGPVRSGRNRVFTGGRVEHASKFSARGVSLRQPARGDLRQASRRLFRSGSCPLDAPCTSGQQDRLSYTRSPVGDSKPCGGRTAFRALRHARRMTDPARMPPVSPWDSRSPA